MSKPEKHEGVVLIHEKVEELLSERQRIAYKEHRRRYIDWLAYEGKNTDALEGYAIATYRVYENITCQFHRYVWEREDRFTLDLIAVRTIISWGKVGRTAPYFRICGTSTK